MNILQRLFKREATVGQTETDEVLAQLAEKEKCEQRAQAERIARANREQQAYTAKITARRENFLRELEAELANLWRVMPELRWHLVGLRQLEQRLDELGDGRSWEDVTGLPFGLADRLSRVIGQEPSGTRLSAEAYTPGHVSKPISGPMPERILRTPRFDGDRAAPAGFVGTWDLVKGAPLDDEGTT